jgi:hypothetical protein
MAKRRLFVGACIATKLTRSDGVNHISNELAPVFYVAASRDEAYEFVMREWQAKFLPTDGWLNHDVGLVEVPEQQLREVLKMLGDVPRQPAGQDGPAAEDASDVQ